MLICSTCDLRLRDADNFLTLCRKSYETLKDFVESRKVEDDCEVVLADETNISTDSEDDDDKPLSNRIEKHSKMQYDIGIVNEAIIAAKQKYNEKRECRLCGFISSNARGLSLHIGHVHK